LLHQAGELTLHHLQYSSINGSVFVGFQ